MEDGYSWIVGIGIVLLVWWIWPNKEEPAYESNYYQGSSYQGFANDPEEDCAEPENPYGYGTGHYAGFAWAESKGVSSCGGNSDSFIEGCEEYINQEFDYDLCLSN